MLGADPDSILRDVEIDPNTLDEPDSLINISSYRRALSLTAKRTATPAFGLQLSQRQSLEKLGPVGYLVRCAPDLGTAFSELTHYLRVHDTGTFTFIEQDGKTAFLTIQHHGVSGESVVQQCELATGLIVKFFRTAIADAWTATAIHFEHKKPADTQAHDRLFRCRVMFEQPLTAIEFPAELLNTKLKTADTGLFAILQNHLERLNEEVGNDFLSQVRRTIQTQIENGPPRLDDTAIKLGLTRHGLQLKLKREDTSFQKLLQEVRLELAQRYLRDTDMALLEISSALALSEPAVFTRSFRKATKITPSEWRRQHRN